MENGEWNGVEESTPRYLDACSFKGKTTKIENKTHRKTKRYKGELQIGERPWWPLAGPIFELLKWCVLCSFWSACFVYVGSFLASFYYLL